MLSTQEKCGSDRIAIFFRHQHSHVIWEVCADGLEKVPIQIKVGTVFGNRVAVAGEEKVDCLVSDFGLIEPRHPDPGFAHTAPFPRDVFSFLR